MFKKVITAIAVAGVLALGASAPAFAEVQDDYPPVVGCTANPATITVGTTSVITCTGLEPNVTGTLTVTGEGVGPDTLSSLVRTAVGTDSVTKTTSATGEVSVSFKGPAAGGFTVMLAADNGQTGSASVTVTAPAEAGLPATGGTVPAAAIWLGVGAIGIGGIAVAAAVARRRAHAGR